MKETRYVPKDFGAGDAPVSSDVMEALVWIQKDSDISVSFTMTVKSQAGYDPWYDVVALAVAGPSEKPGKLYTPVTGRWPNNRHRTLSALLYRMALDLAEVVAVERQGTEAV